MRQNVEGTDMTLRERLAQPSLSTPAGDRSVRPGTDDGDAAELAYRRMRSDLHRQLLDRVDLSSLSVLPAAQLADELRELTERLISESGLVLNAADRRHLLVDIRNEVMGLGPLEPLLAYQTFWSTRTGKFMLSAAGVWNIRRFDSTVSSIC
jgi:pilus assembly protein CpaF